MKIYLLFVIAFFAFCTATRLRKENHDAQGIFELVVFGSYLFIGVAVLILC
jgi:hypothetical protein